MPEVRLSCDGVGEWEEKPGERPLHSSVPASLNRREVKMTKQSKTTHKILREEVFSVREKGSTSGEI